MDRLCQIPWELFAFGPAVGQFSMLWTCIVLPSHAVWRRCEMERSSQWRQDRVGPNLLRNVCVVHKKLQSTNKPSSRCSPVISCLKATFSCSRQEAWMAYGAGSDQVWTVDVNPQPAPSGEENQNCHVMWSGWSGGMLWSFICFCCDIPLWADQLRYENAPFGIMILDF